MSSTNFYFITVLALIFSNVSLAQDIFKTNDARWVIGVEALIPTGGYSVSKNISTGVVVEKPLGQFSVGLSIHYSQTPEFTTNEFLATISPVTSTGAISNRSKSVKATNLYNSTVAQQDYLMAGLELKYRLPCNCFFAYANVNHAEQVNYHEISSRNRSSTSTLSYHDPSPSVLAIGIGLGANVPISKRIRGMLKAGKQYHNGFLANNGKGRREPFLLITAGFQYGLE